MTTHRHDETISFVSWINTPNIAGPLHIRRPRSQKGIAYCDEPIPLRLRGVGEDERFHEFTIEHPDEIPLEIRIERDFARLCVKCARAFTNEVTELHGELSAAPVILSVPIAWQAIYGRTGRAELADQVRDFNAAAAKIYNPTPTAADLEAAAERPLPTDPRENRAFGDAITAEENVVAEDDSLERQDLDAERTWDND